MSDLCCAFENFFSALVDGGNTYDKVTVVHGSVFDPDVEFIFRKNHSDKVDIITMEANEPTAQTIRNITHFKTRSGMPMATTVSTNRLVAALENMPWVIVPGREA